MNSFKNILSVLILLIFSPSCSTKQNEEIVVNPEPLVAGGPDTTTWTLPESIITPHNRYLRYRYNPLGEALLAWGENDFRSEMNCGMPFGSYSPPWYETEWKDFIGVKSGCGTECWTISVLPLNNKDTVRTFPLYLASDYENNLIFYKEDRTGNEFVIENLISGKRKFIELENMEPVAFFMDALDTFYFDNSNLKVKWRMNLDLSSGADRQLESFSQPR